MGERVALAMSGPFGLAATDFSKKGRFINKA